MRIYLLTRFLVCRGNSAPTLEHAVFAFDSALKSRHEVGSSLIQVELRGLLRKCFNCGVARNEVYNVHTSRIKFNFVSTITIAHCCYRKVFKSSLRFYSQLNRFNSNNSYEHHKCWNFILDSSSATQKKSL